jgi:hypothetical protein
MAALGPVAIAAARLRSALQTAHDAAIMAEARQALRRSVVSVDVQWLQTLVDTVADGLVQERREAMERGEFSRVDRLNNEVDALLRSYEKALSRGRAFGGRP